MSKDIAINVNNSNQVSDVRNAEMPQLKKKSSILCGGSPVRQRTQKAVPANCYRIDNKQSIIKWDPVKIQKLHERCNVMSS